MKPRIIPRLLLSEVIAHLRNPEITIITGARQVGKTVLLEMVKDYLVKNRGILAEDILYFNLDIIKDWEFFQDQGKLIEFLRMRSEGKKIYVFVDEAQKVADCARFFKGVYDSHLNVKLILTGSSSLELKAGLKESLSGRKRLFSLSSFCFSEFLTAKDKSLAELLKSRSKIPIIERKRLISYFEEYSIWGGYPKAALARSQKEKLAVLAEIYSSYIEKDIVGLLEIKNKMGFSNLARLLSGQIGQLVNVAELSNALKLDRGTVERYLWALEETFIIKPLIPFYKNPRQEIIKQNKVYFYDPGLRNYCLEDFHHLDLRADRGFLLENSVFKEMLLFLRIFQKIRFWRTKQGSEVDFVVFEKDNCLPIEVKLHLKKTIVPVGLKNFIAKYKPKKAAIVNLDFFDREVKIGKSKIYFIHPYELEDMLKKV